MKKYIDNILKYKMIIIILSLLLYWLFLRVYIPFQVPIHENNHWIFFFNSLLNWNFQFNFFVDHYLFIKESFIEQMNYWYVPQATYGYITSKIWWDYNIIFMIQIILNILTGLLFSLSIYKLSWKKILLYISTILFIILPYDIKFSATEEFLIFWNFFLWLSIFSFIQFLGKWKNIYFYTSIFTYLLALYTRNLYLIFIYVYIILFLFYFINYRKTFQNKFKNLKIHLLFWLSIFTIFSISRAKVLLFTSNKNLNNTDVTNLFELNWYFSSELTPVLFILLFIIGILVPIFYIKNKNNLWNIILYYIFVGITTTLVWLIMLTKENHLLQERLQLIFAPFFIIVTSIWLYMIMRNFKKWCYILPFFLVIPFLYSSEIKSLYSPDQEYLFYKSNVWSLWDNYNLVILWHSEHWVFNNFPEFLLKNKNYKVYWINELDNRYESFIDNYDSLKNENNIFIKPYDCYRWYNIWIKIRKECEFIMDNFNLETISETNITNKPYIFRNNSNQKKLEIWIYKIISLKNVKDSSQN